MNKAHRVVWSEARGAFIVAHEYAATSGKRSSTTTVVAAGLIAALAVLANGADAQTITTPSGPQFQTTTGQTLINQSTISGSSGYAGVNVSGSVQAGAVTNTGTIQGSTASGEANTLDGIVVQSNAALTSGITNSGTASLITGLENGIGVFTAGSVSSIVNAGTISATSSEGNAIVINGANASVGVINNSAGASIIGGSRGIVLLSGATVSSLINAGTISGSSIGIYVEANSGIASLTNSGTISGGEVGLYLAGLSTTSITNSGLISGLQSVGVVIRGQAVGTFSNLSGGVISGASAGLEIAGSTVTSIQNAGTISSSEVNQNDSVYSAVQIYNSTIGSFINQSGGVISGASGVLIEASTVTSFLNAGKIIGNPTQTFSLSFYASSIGSFVNTGTISGGVVGLYGYGTSTLGSLVNQGTIIGKYYGVLLDSTNVTSGVTNTGLISGATVAGLILQNETITGGLSNLSGGVISGASGVNVSDTKLDFIINGAGSTIVGTAIGSGSSESGRAGLGIYQSTITGSIVNAGLISGGAAGLVVSSSLVAGGITNSGSILGGAIGMQISSGASVSSAIVNKAGAVLSGGTIGVLIQSNSTVASLSNAGKISGSLYSVDVITTSSLPSIVISGANTAAFDGDVSALATAVNITSGSTFTGTNAFDVLAFNVASGATLNFGTMASTSGGAAGITAANGLLNAGTVSVGLNKASLTGKYVQSSSGVFSLGASSDTSYGKLVASGTASLSSNAGIFVDVATNNTLSNHETLTGVLQSSGLSASTFDVTDNSSLYSFKGLIDGNNVDLVVSLDAVLLPAAIARGNLNAEGAAAVIDGIITTSGETGAFGSVITDIGKLSSERELSHAASQLLPALSGDGNVATLAALHEMNNVVQSRFEGNAGVSTGEGYLSDRGMWIKPFGSWADLGNTSSAPGFSSTVEGVLIGGDAALSSQARVGLAFGYANADVSGNADAAPNQDRINLYQLIGYGSYMVLPGTEISAQLDGGENTNDTKRSIEFAGQTANASFNSTNAHFGIGVAHPIALSESTTFVPSARVDYTWVQSDSYQEGGAGVLDLHVNSSSYEQLLTSINGKLTQKVNDYMTVFGNIGLGYDSMARDNTAVVSSFAGAPGMAFTTEGVGLKPRVLLAGLGVTSQAHGMTPEVSARYDVERRTNFSNQTVSFKARWAF